MSAANEGGRRSAQKGARAGPEKTQTVECVAPFLPDGQTLESKTTLGKGTRAARGRYVRTNQEIVAAVHVWGLRSDPALIRVRGQATNMGSGAAGKDDHSRPPSSVQGRGDKRHRKTNSQGRRFAA